jgi:hypothetical protein
MNDGGRNPIFTPLNSTIAIGSRNRPFAVGRAAARFSGNRIVSSTPGERPNAALDTRSSSQTIVDKARFFFSIERHLSGISITICENAVAFSSIGTGHLIRNRLLTTDPQMPLVENG